MEYIAVFLALVGVLAVSTAYYVYELILTLRNQAGRITTLSAELKAVKMSLDIHIRRTLSEGQNQAPRPTKKVAPKTLNQRRKDNQ